MLSLLLALMLFLPLPLGILLLGTGKSGAVGFSPSDIAGLQLWLKADAITGLNDGDAVTTWEDSHTSNNDFTQATAAKKPTYQTAEINGKPVVRFDGVDDILENASAFLSSTQGAVFAVLRLADPLITNQYLFGSADDASGTRYWICVLREGVGQPRIRTAQANADTEDSVRGSTSLLASTIYALMWSSNGTDYDLRLNGTSETETVHSGSNTGDWLLETTLRDQFSLGALAYNATETGYCGLDLGELIMYDTEPSAADIASIEAYLDARWAF
jgi:hypothetical protein